MNQSRFRYAASASAQPLGEVTVDAVGLSTILSAPPTEFGGPGDRWSPETLLVAAVADCFVLTFRAVARASKLPWTSITCTADGILERVDRIPQFTNFTVTAHLRIPRGTDPSSASRVLVKAKQACLISHSLKAPTHLELRVEEDESSGVYPAAASPLSDRKIPLSMRSFRRLPQRAIDEDALSQAVVRARDWRTT